MTSILSHIESQPQSTQRLLGIKYEQLQLLLSKAIELESQKRKIAENQKVRLMASGGGRKPKLSPQEQIILTPKKKPNRKPLTLEEKENNRELASERIFVEHVIRLVKICFGSSRKI